MKCYNVQNYIRYKKDIKQWSKRVDWCRPWDEMTRDELIVKFMPLVENIARKFKDSDAANGVISLSDRIQFGNIGLVKAVDKIAGWMFLNDINGRDKIFYTTGRLTSEMVIKTVQMEIPILLSRSGFTESGVSLANEAKLSLIGRMKGKRFILLSGNHRVIYD